ncbi:sugar phosphate isomerase/epimerase [Pollutibacter soli]|uniref:sugar phosphate isomerase/epimerase family protein n=1 Tax=Pollutibacter soli TaxID=3034157 RepID=UPI0030136E97
MFRREFIRNAGIATVGGLMLPGLNSLQALPKATKYKYGVQLFTFFTTIDQDVEGTLKKIADLGYTEIESAFSRKGGYYGKTAKEFAAMLKAMGMTWKSHHVTGMPFKMPANAKPPVDANGNPITIPPIKNLQDDTDVLVKELSEAGVPYLVCASTPVKTAEEIKQSKEILRKSGEAAKKAGITLCFHNHEAEFKSVDGVTPYDEFLSISPDILKFELDLAWASKAGANPVELFKKHKGRFPLWHVKDIDASGKPCALGQGTIDFKPIFAAAKEAGLKQFFVEHDMPSDAFASLTTSKFYLDKLLG